MSSRIDSTAPAIFAPGDLAPRLKRFCTLLGVEGASLALAGPQGVEMLAATGPQPGNIAQLSAESFAASRSVILSDTGAMIHNHARFYVGLLAHTKDGAQSYLLSLFDRRPRSPLMASRMAGLAREAAATCEVAQQRRLIERQAVTIADYAAMEEHRRALFDRASETARIGIWHCNLSDNSITWTNGVYDLFEIPRDTPLARDITLGLYTDESRRAMEAARAEAIANCSEFSIDCEIITQTGKRRWMRLTGAVESRDGIAYRIFGMKQDITEEKLMGDRTRYLAEYDTMTGLANRSLFQLNLDRIDQGHREIGALLLVDLDGFKQVNDTYGHAVGDQCLKGAARRLNQCCGNADLVARIGGDEFAVLLGKDTTSAEAASMAQQIVAKIGRPLHCGDTILTLGASVGVAQYRGGSSEDLFRQADTALYAAKTGGRGTSRFYDAAQLSRAV